MGDPWKRKETIGDATLYLGDDALFMGSITGDYFPFLASSHTPIPAFISLFPANFQPFSNRLTARLPCFHLVSILFFNE
jgi:hypothetical protein